MYQFIQGVRYIFSLVTNYKLFMIILGLSPSHLNGKKVGVYVGSSFSDTEKKGFFDSVSRIGLGIVG